MNSATRNATSSGIGDTVVAPIFAGDIYWVVVNTTGYLWLRATGWLSEHEGSGAGIGEIVSCTMNISGSPCGTQTNFTGEGSGACGDTVSAPMFFSHGTYNFSGVRIWGRCVGYSEPVRGYWSGPACDACSARAAVIAGCVGGCPVDAEGHLCSMKGTCWGGVCTCVSGYGGAACDITI